MGSRIDEVNCRYCLEEQVYMDVKEEPTLYKIGAECNGCGHDYGVINKVPRSEIGYVDQVFEEGEESIRELLE
jgi:hypothetical protein